MESLQRGFKMKLILRFEDSDLLGFKYKILRFDCKLSEEDLKILNPDQIKQELHLDMSEQFEGKKIW